MSAKKDQTSLSFAREMRRGMTCQERRLWYEFLRSYPLKFRRQHVIGRYILDFYCPRAKIGVEIDGSQHFDEAAIQYDSMRTAFLEEQGITMLRYTNHEVNTLFYGVCEDIDRRVTERVQN